VTATAQAMSAFIERSNERSSERDVARRDEEDD